jgi:hypothetical protein|tara:strand:- start:15350 stop:16081 length:732 start_codon:yes stop_codon:yes gene_type:complete
MAQSKGFFEKVAGQSMAAPSTYNKATGGQGYAVGITNGQIFFAGLGFDGGKINVDSATSHGYVYSDSDEDLEVFVDTTAKIVYPTGETENLTAMADSEIIKGSLVLIEGHTDSSGLSNDGLYKVKSFDASASSLHLEKTEFEGFLGDIKDGVSDANDSDSVYGTVTLLPFPPTFKIVPLDDGGIAGIEANNWAGQDDVVADIPAGTELLVEAFKVTSATSDASCICYLPCYPSLKFHPQRETL